MKEKPILFCGEMVQAILGERKRQTRRVVNLDWWDCCETGMKEIPSPDHGYLQCPYGESGDRLWVRETHWRYGVWRKNGLTKAGKQKWTFVALPHDLGVKYSKPGPEPKRGKRGWHKRPSIFMPRSASRINLEITGVRVERVNEISVADCLAEGMMHGFYQYGYRQLWDKLNEKRGLGWLVNPWVWVVEFRRIV